MIKNQLAQHLKNGHLLRYASYLFKKGDHPSGWNLYNTDGEIVKSYISKKWVSELLNKRKIVQKDNTYVWRSAA